MFGLANYGLVRFGLVLWTLKSFKDFNEISFIKILSVGHHIGLQLTEGLSDLVGKLWVGKVWFGTLDF